MDSNIQIFNNPQFGNVRIAMNESNEPLFCLADVAKALGYSNAAKAVIDHCKGVTVLETPTTSGIQPIKFGKESEVYRLVMKSKLPDAEKFQDWVCEDILPSIRKHGGYLTPEAIEQTLTNPDFIIQLATSLKEERQKRIDVEAKAYQQEEVIEHKNEEIKKLLPDAQYARDTLKSASTLTATQVAKELGMSAVTLNKKLHEFGIQYKVGEQWVLYAKYEDRGYTKTDTYTEIRNGESRTYHSTVWTESGRKFIIELINKGKVA